MQQYCMLSQHGKWHSIAVTCAFKPQNSRETNTQFFTGRMPFLLLWHCWLGDRNGIRPVKKTGCWFVGGDDLTGALYVIPPVVTTTSIILSSNKIQTGDILVPANAGPHGKWPLMEWVWKLRRTWIRYTAQRIRQIRINLHLLWSMPSL